MRRILVGIDFDLTLSAQRVFGDKDFDRFDEFLFGGTARIQKMKDVIQRFHAKGFVFLIASWNFR